MFDPNQQPALCEQYLSRYLGCRVRFVRAERLSQSTREAPWRLDVIVDNLPRSYVLQLDTRGMEREYRVLQALETVAVPAPHVYGLDPRGEALGVACFFSEFVTGDSLLAPMLAGQTWAEQVYLDAVCALQAVTEDQLGEVAGELDRETAADVLEDAYCFLRDRSLPVADAAYRVLKASMPVLPALRFSNGDLWLENFITRDEKLAAVIDFQHAGFSDPVFEFLLSFFVSPELQGRGIEARYCQRIGCDPAILHWYHGLEYFDTLRWVLLKDEGFAYYTAQSLEANLTHWLDSYHE